VPLYLSLPLPGLLRFSKRIGGRRRRGRDSETDVSTTPWWLIVGWWWMPLRWTIVWTWRLTLALVDLAIS
jgi:hypothetical protein